MCHHRPCWGSVAEFKKIIDAGHANLLMIDYWAGGGEGSEFQDDVQVLCGAIVGYEKYRAPFIPIGTCALLDCTSCMVHKIKPSEGAMACCKEVDTNEKQYKKMKMALVRDWDTEKGRQLIDKWKELVGFEEWSIDKKMNMIDKQISNRYEERKKRSEAESNS